MKYILSHFRIVLIVIFLMIIGCIIFVVSSKKDYPNLNSEPSVREYLFETVAIDFKVSKLCEKISPAASEGYGFNPYGYQAVLLKSDCYRSFAYKYNDAEACSHVTPINSGNGQDYTEKNCLKGISSTGIDTNDMGRLPPKDYLEKIFTDLGYTGDEVLASVPGQTYLFGEIQAFDKKNKKSPDFLERVNKITGYAEQFNDSTIRPANSFEYLFARTAVENKSADLCGKISPNSFDLKENGVTKISLRNICYQQVAFNTNTPAMCDKVNIKDLTPITGVSYYSEEFCKKMIYDYYVKSPDLSWCDDEKFPKGVSREQCRENLSHKVDRVEGPLSLKMEILKEIVLNFGFITPNIPPPFLYEDFYYDILKSKDPKRTNEFITRVQALPSDR